MKPFVLGAIFARGGSKGLPRKNIRPLAGKPLIAYAIEAALASKLIDRVVVSTDDAEIARIALQHGAEVPFMRPSELAADDSPELLAWRHALQELDAATGQPKVDVLAAIPPTSPLRAVEDVDACIQKLLDSDADVVITVRPAERSPYFNMVRLDGEGYARLVIPPEEAIYHRQVCPPVFDVTTIAFAARPEFVLKSCSLYEGKVRAVMVPPERALDIDSELDLKFAEFCLGSYSSGQ